MTVSVHRPMRWLLSVTLALCSCASVDVAPQPAQPANAAQEKEIMPIHYLEIVTADVDATCDSLERVHGVNFSQPDPMLGNARTATLEDSQRIGVRAPMAEHEQPILRPYMRVSDIAAALDAAAAAGAEIAMGATEIPGQGQFAIYILGGIHYGLWEL